MLRVVAWRGRHVLACVGVGILAAAVVTAASPAPPAQRTVLALAHDVPAGEPLVAAALTVVDVPADLAPPCALGAPGGAVGAAPAVSLRAGTFLCAEMLVRGAAELPPGTAAVPVRLADPQVAGLLTAGMRVDVVVPSSPDVSGEPVDADGRVLTRNALVLPSPAPTASSDGGLLGVGAAAEPVVLLAVRVKEAPTVAAVAVSGSLGVVLVG